MIKCSLVLRYQWFEWNLLPPSLGLKIKGMFPETSLPYCMASHARRLNIICTTMTTNKLIHFLVAAVVVVVVMSGPAVSQDRLKLEEQDHCDQHLSCTSASLRLQNCQLVKKMN
jgi:hypothetical protein